MLRIDHSCRFPHDRVQEAAYSLVPESDRAGLHLEIGRRLWARTPPAERAERTFEIATQLNHGASLIASREERESVAEINLSAGKRAKDSAAYAPRSPTSPPAAPSCPRTAGGNATSSPSPSSSIAPNAST